MTPTLLDAEWWSICCSYIAYPSWLYCTQAFFQKPHIKTKILMEICQGTEALSGCLWKLKNCEFIFIFSPWNKNLHTVMSTAVSTRVCNSMEGIDVLRFAWLPLVPTKPMLRKAVVVKPPLGISVIWPTTVISRVTSVVHSMKFGLELDTLIQFSVHFRLALMNNALIMSAGLA